MTGQTFEMRAPWYVRERQKIDVNDRRSLRPVIQMYDSTKFIEQLTKDPGTSLKFRKDDRWSYPVPANFPNATGRKRFATSALVHTRLRKLYQPSHSRFYVVVVEVFCDQPGLPRAGSHDDFDVHLYMRRQQVTVKGSAPSMRRLARTMLAEFAKDDAALETDKARDADLHDLGHADYSWHQKFQEDNAGLFDQVDSSIVEQAWITGVGGGWRQISKDADHRPAENEEKLPMWRLPPRENDCKGAKTRSLWFGVVPTYSSEHWVDKALKHAKAQPKLDERSIYQLRCVVTTKPKPGKEDCPPVISVSEATEPFRLASAYDPDGTKNHTVSITTPDLRRLAARAGQRQGPGGMRITSPPQSRFVFNPFNGVPKTGSIGAAGGTCTFAFELFFLVALFLFLMFLPIIVLIFQLWWMLALRFCFPRAAVSLSALTGFFAGATTFGDLPAAPTSTVKAYKGMVDELFGMGDKDPSNNLLRDEGWANALNDPEDPPGTKFFNDGTSKALVNASDPRTAKADVTLKYETTPPDPLCPSE